MKGTRCRRYSLRGSTLLDAVLCVVVVLVLVAVLMPVFTHHGCGSPTTYCQSNLKQIGVSVRTYLTDWDQRYPTNRPFLTNGKLDAVSNSVALSKVAVDQQTGKPIRFQHGITWVEGLYQYMEPIAARDDGTSAWKRQSVADGTTKPASQSAAVTYVFNRNLIEKSEKNVRDARTLMMAREVDRLVDSDLRPTYDSTRPNHAPVSAFLTDKDQILGQTKPDTHGTGSHILFADGHVKLFSTEQMPSKCRWDPNTKAWGNADDTITVSP